MNRILISLRNTGLIMIGIDLVHTAYQSQHSVFILFVASWTFAIALDSKELNSIDNSTKS